MAENIRIPVADKNEDVLLARKEADEEREAMIEILHLINSPGSPLELMQPVCGFLKRQFGCDAIGIRLKDGEDFPYFGTSGFSGKSKDPKRVLSG
jgi:hypothetical protein